MREDAEFVLRQYWLYLCDSGQVPANIPREPDVVYPEFVSWQDWFGVNDQEIDAFLRMNAKSAWERYRR